MFEPDPSIRYIPATREQVVALVESINQPQVSIPGKEPQAVQGFLCGLRNQNGTFSIFVSLYLPRTGENVVYVSDKREVGMEEYRDVEVEGLHFLESMGFMLDNLNFRNLAAGAAGRDPEAGRRSSTRRARPTAPGVEARQTERIARLLASV